MTSVEVDYRSDLERSPLLFAKSRKCSRIIEHAGITWEVDVFHGDNEGLAFAEVELKEPDQKLDLPPWIGKDVTDDPRYFYTRLSETPFKEWNEAYTVILYFAPAARELGERLAGQLNEVGFRVRADDWSEAKEPEDGPLTFYAPVNTVYFHPTAEAKAVQIRDGWAHGFALKEGDVTGHGSTWVVGPRLIYLLAVASEAEP